MAGFFQVGHYIGFFPTFCACIVFLYQPFKMKNLSAKIKKYSVDTSA
jgi:hypothetical protein